MSKTRPSNALNEVRLTWAGKLLFATVAARLAAAGLRKIASGMSEQSEPEEEKMMASFPFKLQGTPEQMQAMKDVIVASKEYQEEIGKEGATVESVMQKLNAQNEAKKAFQDKTGYAWPL
jgi:hypothetical protein